MKLMFVTLAVNPMLVINMILFAIVIGIIVYEGSVIIRAKRAAKVITEDEFKEGMRTAQVVDVREKETFDAGHIMGARNIPYSMLKQSSTSLRKDKPIYIYDQKKALSKRAVILLKKEGFTDLYILKGGFNDWSGKVKVKF